MMKKCKLGRERKPENKLGRRRHSEKKGRTSNTDIWQG
jgi:hypothetical protein